MAKKKKKVQVVQATAPSPGEMIGVGTGATTRMGGAAASANVAGKTTQLGGMLGILQSGGAAALDPRLQAQLDALQASVDRVNKGPLRQINTLSTQITNAQADITRLEGKETLTRQEQAQLARARKTLQTAQGKLEPLEARVAAQDQRITDFRENNVANAPTATDLLAERFPELQQTLNEASPYLDRMGQLGASGDRLMQALNQGYSANQITGRDVQAAQMGPVADVRAQQIGASTMGDFGQAQAARMGPIADVRAQQIGASTMGDFGRANATSITAGQVGQGTLGASLMNRAQAGIDRAGRLSPEAQRDAIQAARQGFAARGLATGSAALGAELLNRDRYSRQREFEDLGFAQQVQGQDLGRQFQNVGNALTAAQGNQSAALQAEMANLQARYNAMVQNGNWQQAAAIQNQMATLQADQGNQQTAFNVGQTNATNQQQAEIANLEARRLAAVQNGEWQQAAAIANQLATLEADKANQTTSFNTNSFNTQQGNLVNMSNADRALNASIANEEAQRMGTALNTSMLGQAFTTDRLVNQEGLGAALQRGSLAGAGNSNNMLMQLYGAQPDVGSQALPGAASMANTWATNATNVGMFNANAQMWANAANMYGSGPQQGSGAGAMIGGIAGGVLGGAAGYFASGGNPMFAMGGYTAGSQIGAGVGGQFR
jgi:protein-arginine kinase activator protein McsA